jgi:hypothetical protein
MFLSGFEQNSFFTANEKQITQHFFSNIFFQIFFFKYFFSNIFFNIFFNIFLNFFHQYLKKNQILFVKTRVKNSYLN